MAFIGYLEINDILQNSDIWLTAIFAQSSSNWVIYTRTPEPDSILSDKNYSLSLG
jgi:hypothetical protein